MAAVAGLICRPATALDTVDAIRDCMRANLPEQTSQQKIELSASDRAGGRRTLQAQLLWKLFESGRPRVRISVEAPPDLRDSAYLLIEKERDRESDMYMYMPMVGKARRIAARSLSDQLWGTDFSYEDMRQLQWIAAEGDHERLPDAQAAGRPAYVLSLKMTLEDESAYERIVSFIDHETCVALRIEFFERGEDPRKVLSADPASLTQHEGRWMATRLEMSDRRDETSSDLRIVEVHHDVEIPDRVFSPSRLGKGR